MKKAIFMPLLIVVLATVLCLCLVACNKSNATATDTTACYDLSIRFDESLGIVTLNEDVLFTNNSSQTLNELKFHLYPNAFAEGVSSSPFHNDELSEVYYDGTSYGGIEVLSVKINRENTTFEIAGTDETILSANCTLGAGDSATVSIAAEITLPKCNARFGITEKTVSLTGFYPVLCRFENGAWREDAYTAIGDPFYSDISSFYATATLPSDYVVASSGKAEATVDGDVQTVEICAESIRDFAMILSRDFETSKSTATLNGRSVEVVSYSLSNRAESTAGLASKAIEVFSSSFGEYPYDTYSVVEAPINSGGMEYGGLVVVCPNTTSHSDVVVHETAHQWWYNTVGNDQINRAWLDEGLTEFCTAYFHLLNGDKAEYDRRIASLSKSYSTWSELPSEVGFDEKMNRPLAGFLTAGEYVAVVYSRGALMFASLRDTVGDEIFCSALKTYYIDNKFLIADENSLIAAFEKNGRKLAPIINAWVNG